MSKKFQIIKTTGAISMVLGENSQMMELIQLNRQSVEKAWQEAVARRKGHLFNGTLASLVQLSNEGDQGLVLKVCFVEYKHFLAQRDIHDLDLGIRPVGVSGLAVIRSEDGKRLLFAKRSQTTTQYPGHWELVPSGGIDKGCLNADGSINYHIKLMEEFVEETGLTSDYVQEIVDFSVIYDERDMVYDIGCEVRIEGGTTSHIVLEAFERSREYVEPVLVSESELHDFLGEKTRLVPTTEALLVAWREREKAYTSRG